MVSFRAGGGDGDGGVVNALKKVILRERQHHTTERTELMKQLKTMRQEMMNAIAKKEDERHTKIEADNKRIEQKLNRLLAAVQSQIGGGGDDEVPGSPQKSTRAQQLTGAFKTAAVAKTSSFWSRS